MKIECEDETFMQLFTGTTRAEAPQQGPQRWVRLRDGETFDLTDGQFAISVEPNGTLLLWTGPVENIHTNAYLLFKPADFEGFDEVRVR